MSPATQGSGRKKSNCLKRKNRANFRDNCIRQGLAPIRAVSWPLHDVISLCVQNFVPAKEGSSTNPSVSQSRICSWVEVLPELVGGDHNVLPSCVRALALSIVAIGCDGRALICDAFEAQSSALRALQNAIGRPNIPLCDEVAAAIMCLFLADILHLIDIQGTALCLTRSY